MTSPFNSTTPLYSVIIPAYNEEDHLPECLEHLDAAMRSCPLPGEVIVADNNSTDRTATIAAASGATVVFEEHRQISRARNRGAAAARGRYLIFIDADSVISPQLLELTLEELTSGRSCGGGAQVAFNGAAPKGARMLMGTWNLFAPLFCNAAGCYVFADREIFFAVGGFNETRYAGEELDLSRKMARLGKRRHQRFTIITAAMVLTSPRKVHAHSFLKILGLFLLLGLCPFLLRSKKMCFLWYDCR